MGALTRGEAIGRILARANLDEFAERVPDSFWEQPEFQELHPPREPVLALVRWNLDLVTRWLEEGRPPSEAELEVLRDQARARAAEGFPADLVPANFRRGARFAWRALLDAATEAERPALLESADLLFDYVDRVSRIFSEVYEDVSRAEPTSAEEAAARALLGRIAADQLLLAEDHQLADRIGLELERASRPFVIALPGRPAECTPSSRRHFVATGCWPCRKGAGSSAWRRQCLHGRPSRSHPMRSWRATARRSAPSAGVRSRTSERQSRLRWPVAGRGRSR